jgi:ribonuclease HI
LQGRVYIDGSVHEAQWAQAAVGAWAAVSFEGQSEEPLAILAGPLEELIVDSDGAELTALIECLAGAVPPIVVVTDSDFVYKGVTQLGKLRTLKRGAAWVHLWAKFWQSYEGFGGLRDVDVERVRRRLERGQLRFEHLRFHEVALPRAHAREDQLRFAGQVDEFHAGGIADDRLKHIRRRHHAL